MKALQTMVVTGVVGASLILSLPTSVFANGQAETEPHVVETKTELNQTEDNEFKLPELRDQVSVLKGKAKELEKETKEHDEKIAFLGEIMHDYQEQIIKKQKEIDKIGRVWEKNEQTREKYKHFIQDSGRMQQKSESYLDLLFDSRDLGDMLSRFIDHQKIVSTNATMQDQYESIKASLEYGEEELTHELILLKEKNETMKALESRYRELEKGKKEAIETVHQQLKETEKRLAKAKEEKAEQNRINSAQTTNLDQVALAEGKVFLRPTTGVISSEFGSRWGRMHNGIDYANKIGTSVIAAADGEVTRARHMNGYGNTVTIKHFINGQTYETLYAHLNQFSVSVGDKVSAGQEIAKMGNTGRSTGPHLHFETHVGGGWNGAKSNAENPRRLVQE
ncbi:M23 family metallopeptidase [Bacillus piscicola]|uniref:M23 family metallopeptidase n=1 Tax=Bacillus piscicola TaxID=1632684 RepID=UPI001F08AD70|nr:M23 family metallopeptidase [Bacillus piscicola]